MFAQKRFRACDALSISCIELQSVDLRVPPVAWPSCEPVRHRLGTLGADEIDPAEGLHENSEERSSTTNLQSDLSLGVVATGNLDAGRPVER